MTSSLDEKIQKLRDLLLNNSESLKNLIDEQNNCSKNKDNHFYRSQWQYTAECDNLIQELRLPRPEHFASTNKHSFVFDPLKYSQKIDLFRGLKKYCKPLYMEDPLPPSPPNHFIPKAPASESFTEMNIPIAGLNKSNYKRSPRIFVSEIDESESSAECLHEQTEESGNKDAAPAPAAEPQTLTKVDIVVQNRPLQIALDSKRMLVKGVLEGEGKKAGLRIGDRFELVNGKPASMTLLSMEPLPLKLTVLRNV
ncbi:hypothetical protein MHBO_003120 [Bonamia ostreae]|uniref:Uncharacterized protein n=1 Tax=Bonamia ostreae TaxID=126728 RepID=A0ABV2APJ0_9EUKA